MKAERFAVLAAPVLLVAAGLLLVLFCEGPGLAGMGDDSASYLTLARHMAGTAGAALSPWVPYHAHFPPLFPALLAATGGGQDPVLAHRLVAALALAGVAASGACAARRLGSLLAGLAVALLFLALPGAWIALKGILSESTFLAVSMGALLFHQARLEGRRAGPGPWLAFGVMLAACYLSRAIAVVLWLAFAAQVVTGWWSSRRRGEPIDLMPFAALLPALVLAGAWLALRPAGDVDLYRVVGASRAHRWLEAPAEMAALGFSSFARGWIANFTADFEVPVAMQVPALILGVLALAGSLRALRHNRLDGWYAVGSLVLIAAWVFPPDNMRRLLYPLLPLLIVHAAEAIGALCAARHNEHLRTRVSLAVAALTVVICLPGLVLVAQRAFDRTPLAGSRYALADMTDYYTTLDGTRARAIAARHIAVLDGLEGLRTHTPPEARILWTRPEYVALLGDRAGVAWLYEWDAATIARKVQEERVTHVLASRLSKTDLAGVDGDPYRDLNSVGNYTWVIWKRDNAVTGEDDFVLLQVWPEWLEKYRKGG